jgi:predicted ATPase
MLQRVEIRDFRSCHGVVLDDLTPMTVLAGRNAVGKSNILRAIQWAADTATAGNVAETTSNSGNVAFRAGAGNLVFEYSIGLTHEFKRDPDPRLEYHLFESLSYSEGRSEFRRVFRRQNEKLTLATQGTGSQSINVGPNVPSMPALAALLPTSSRELVLIRPFLSALQAVRYYPLLDEKGDENDRVVLQGEYDRWLSGFHQTGDPGTAVLIRLLHMSLTKREQFEELRSLLGPNGLALLDDIEIELPRPERAQRGERFYWFRFRPNWHSKRSPYLSLGDLSDGTQRVIRILIGLLFDQSGVMLVEHPEDKIHPGLLRRLIDLLRSYSAERQLIVASHSPAVFNSLDPESIRLVTMEQGETKVRALSSEETHVAGKYLEEEGSLADFLETVEGE